MRVLLVEDQKNVRDAFCDMFEEFGGEFEVCEAGSVIEALWLVESEGVDAALVDMGLPLDEESEDPAETNDDPAHGEYLLRELKDVFHLPVIALTGTTDADILRWIEAPLVSKPVKDFEKEIVERLRAFAAESCE